MKLQYGEGSEIKVHGTRKYVHLYRRLKYEAIKRQIHSCGNVKDTA